MKKIIFLFAIILLVQSCDLEKYPLDSVSPNTFFETENELKLYTNSFYNMLPSAEGVYNETVDNIIKNSLTDELRGTRIVPTSGGDWSWNNLRNINFYLENSHKCDDEKARNKYDAVAKFFRAYFYFDKMKKFGDVPWYSEVISDQNLELLTKARDPRTLIMDSIVADLDFAIDNLPNNRSLNEVTKWTALSFKARACLFEGTFRKYHDEFNLSGYEELLSLAAEASNNVIMNSGYSIYSTGNYEKDYLNFFASINSLPEEVILGRSFSDELQVYHNLNYYTMTASYGRPGLEKELVNSYLMADGSRFTDKDNFDKIFFTEEMKNRDPRLTQTVRSPGYTRIGEFEKLVQEFGSTVTGYQLIKFVTEKRWDTVSKSINDMPIIRFAELLLIYAEAKAELGTLTQEDLEMSIKMIRDRVNMPNISIENSNSNPDPYLEKQYPKVKGDNKGVILEIRRERRIELVMESHRWDDMIRWKEGSTFTKQFRGMYFPGIGSYDLDGDGLYDICIYKGDKPNVEGKNVQYLLLDSDITLENGDEGCIVINPHIEKKWDENKDYLFPIPIQERLLNPNLKQNPKWNDGLE